MSSDIQEEIDKITDQFATIVKQKIENKKRALYEVEKMELLLRIPKVKELLEASGVNMTLMWEMLEEEAKEHDEQAAYETHDDGKENEYDLGHDYDESDVDTEADLKELVNLTLEGMRRDVKKFSVVTPQDSVTPFIRMLRDSALAAYRASEEEYVLVFDISFFTLLDDIEKKVEKASQVSTQPSTENPGNVISMNEQTQSKRQRDGRD